MPPFHVGLVDITISNRNTNTKRAMKYLYTQCALPKSLNDTVKLEDTEYLDHVKFCWHAFILHENYCDRRIVKLSE